MRGRSQGGSRGFILTEIMSFKNVCLIFFFYVYTILDLRMFRPRIIFTKGF